MHIVASTLTKAAGRNRDFIFLAFFCIKLKITMKVFYFLHGILISFPVLIMSASNNHEVMMMTALMLVMMMMSIMVLEMFHKNCCRTCRQNSVSSSLPFLLHCFFYTTELFLLRCRLKAHLLLFKLRVVKFASTNSLLE